MSSSGWCTIESDPGVFTELISEIGVKGVQVQELWDLDVKSAKKLEPIYGLIFLFKWQKDQDGDQKTVLEDGAPGVFFAKQMINNACATQAIINVLLNRDEIELGETLNTYKAFAMDCPPGMRGELLDQFADIRTAHNSFARPEPFIMTSKEASDDDEAFHFVGYVPINGNVYELDGLRPGPILIGDAKEDWLSVALPAVQERMNQYAAKEIRFTLLALTKNRKEVLEAKLKELEDSKSNTDADVGAIEAEIASVKDDIQAEVERFAKWKTENIRRKHDYVPFIFNLLKKLAQKGKLDDLTEKAKEAMKERLEAKKSEADK